MLKKILPARQSLAPGACRRVVRYALSRMTCIGVATVVLFVGALLLSINITKPFIGQHDWNGVVYGQQAKNFVRYGYLPLRFGATLSAGKKSLDELTFSTHYPPTLPILISFSYQLFGVSEWSTRLLPILASISSLFLIMLLGTELVSWRVGMIAGAFAVVTPMFIYYGKNPVHEIVQLPFSLLAFYSYVKWRRTSINTWKFLIFGSLTVAMLVGWPGYYATVLIALHGFLFERSRRTMLMLPTVALVVFALYLWHVQIIVPGSIAEISSAAKVRIGAGGVPVLAWLGREVRYAVNLFTGTLLGLSGIWMIRTVKIIFQKFYRSRTYSAEPASQRGEARRVKSGMTMKGFRDDNFLAFLGLYGVAHVVLFRDASWFHEYLLFPLLPFLAISSAMAINSVLQRVKRELMKVVIIVAALVAVGLERAGYAKALLTSEYARRDYEEAIQFAREHQGKNIRIPEERDVYFVFYTDQLD